MWAYRRSPHLQRREPVKRPEHGWAWHSGQAACVAKEKGESQDMQHGIPEDASGLATEGSFGCAGAGSSIPCEELATTTSTLLHTKRSVPLFTIEPMGRLGGATYSWPSSRKRALEAALLSRSSATCSIGTTGVKTTAELLEQQDTSASATGTTRALPAIRRPISGSSYVLRAGLPQARRRPPSAGQLMGAGVDYTPAMSRRD